MAFAVSPRMLPNGARWWQPTPRLSGGRSIIWSETPAKGHRVSGVDRCDRWVQGIARRAWLRQLKGFRQRLFGFGRKLRLMPSHEDGGNNNKDQEAQTEAEHHPPAQLLGPPTQRIRRKPIERRPEKCADDIGQHEMRPGHAIGSGKDPGDRAQDW